VLLKQGDKYMRILRSVGGGGSQKDLGAFSGMCPTGGFSIRGLFSRGDVGSKRELVPAQRGVMSNVKLWVFVGGVGTTLAKRPTGDFQAVRGSGRDWRVDGWHQFLVGEGVTLEGQGWRGRLLVCAVP